MLVVHLLFLLIDVADYYYYYCLFLLLIVIIMNVCVIIILIIVIINNIIVIIIIIVCVLLFCLFLCFVDLSLHNNKCFLLFCLFCFIYFITLLNCFPHWFAYGFEFQVICLGLKTYLPHSIFNVYFLTWHFTMQIPIDSHDLSIQMMQ